VDLRYIEEHGLETGKPLYVISILDNYSRALLASLPSPRQDLTAYLVVLRAALLAHGAPEVLVSDSGSIFLAKQARAIYRALGIEKREIARGQAWQNYVETHCNIMRRMADHGFARAVTWEEFRAVHERFFRDYNEQAHHAHRARPVGRRSPAVVLGWVRGAWCDAADLDRLFRVRAHRRVNAHGFVRFRHWRFYGERGLRGAEAAVWVLGETLTVEHAADTLAQYRVAFEPDGLHIRAVSAPRFFPARRPSPQPWLPALATLDWRPALRLPRYRAYLTRRAGGTQLPLFPPTGEPQEAAEA
jgi:hypothetical protein